MKLLVPLKLIDALPDAEIAPPSLAKLLIKLVVPLKLSTVLLDA